ncbi:MAG TPA: hypothetical protein DF427_12700 [Moraxellaceae bacterium]|nr:hypothetical protein [Moraxellaceae bacterium]
MEAKKVLLVFGSRPEVIKMALLVKAGNSPKSGAAHYEQRVVFFEAEKKTLSPHKRIDPAQWRCTPNCAVGQGATSFHRYNNHLSVHGALHYADMLAAALSPAINAARGAGGMGGN